MTSTLTERYIAAVTKTLNSSAQDDVRVELEASIADAVDARLEQGEAREDAERTVLTELGDPAALAAGFADRPLLLIGPRYYLTWWRLLKLLLIIVPVSVAGAVALGQTIAGGDVGEIIGSAIGIGLSVAVHLAFWVTLVFAVLERTGADTGVRWDVDQLPEPQVKEAPRAELIASLAYLVIMTGAVLWDHFRGFFPTGGEHIPILNPELWPWWIGALFVLMGAEVVIAIAVYGNKRWNKTLAVMNTALAVLFVSWWLTLLGRGQLINPDFVEFAFTGAVDENVLRILAVVTGFVAVGIAVWDSVDGWLKARRAALQA